MLRIEPVHDVEHSATPRDLQHIVAASREAGEITRELSALLDRIMDFPTSSAEHAMIPRSRVDVVSDSDTVSEVLARMAGGHARYPVTSSDHDEIVGVIHLHDLLASVSGVGTATAHCRPAPGVSVDACGEGRRDLRHPGAPYVRPSRLALTRPTVSASTRLNSAWATAW
ncbi:hypothetical protein MDOR_25710 [Mycolicibacterium doricum]|uniref:CBS domain-containing protein n=1 Tax=Mycolicibacterium doricum TaxID=126673 RepID=A0A1X1TD55_9MYCO|nr:hypothetical protein AWC01_08310 [Mycolicibacterium doricum]BBZ08402.1 hypothetical protein MDOR_25710 [Mycolicibacterium doricum]